MIDKATIDRIVDTARIEEVIGDFVTLKRRGANYTACCPFHNEKTPSFSVSPSKGIFKCFGCGKSGGAVSFIMEHENMSYVEALKYLGKKYGIEVRDKEETPEEIVGRLRYENMLVISEFAQKLYSDTLFEDPMAQVVGLSYFKETRGFRDDTIRKFGLGFAPAQKDFLHPKAIKAGYDREYLISTGLCYERDNDKQLVDRFHERVIFPIHSLSGRVIAFGGRTLKADKTIAKYLNSPESEIYHKSRSLYGIFFAKATMSKEDKCYLVEGYTDVISMYQAGIENVVASSGTSLTVEQIRLIKRFTNNVTVLYDADPAGIKASIRGIDLLLEEGMVVKVVLFPDGEDPDSFARKNYKEKIESYILENEQDFIEFKYDLLSEDIAKDPIKKARLITEIVKTISLIPDQIIRSVYIEQSSIKLNVKQELLTEEVAKERRRKITSDAYQKERDAEREQRRAQVAEFTGEAGSNIAGSVDSGMNGGVSYPAETPFITNAVTDTCEKELLYWMIKWGEEEMVFEDDFYINREKPEHRPTVAEYIAFELKSDDLEFLNPLNKKIFDLYFDFIADETDQDKILRLYTNHPDQTIVRTVHDIILEKYSLDIKEFQQTIVPEQTTLFINVPKSILLFKAKVVEFSYHTLIKSLEHAQKEGDNEGQKQIMQQLKIFMKIRNELSKKLNRPKL